LGILIYSTALVYYYQTINYMLSQYNDFNAFAHIV